MPNWKYPDEAAAIARRAGELVERVLSTAALAEYAAAVLEGYAALDAANRPRQPEVEGGRHVRFACELRDELILLARQLGALYNEHFAE